MNPPHTQLLPGQPASSLVARPHVEGWEGFHDDVRKILEAPFGQDQIRKDVKRHTDGWEMTYVEAAAVIERLNTAFQSEWSFQVVSYQTVPGQVIVTGRLTVPHWARDPGGNWHRVETIKEQYGSCFLRQRGQAYVDLGADYKAAATDALKKCATQFGMALSLYSRDEAPPQGMARTGNLPQQGTYPAVQVNPSEPAMPFQVEAVKQMFARLGVADPDWWQGLGFSEVGQLTQGHVQALLAGEHPWVKQLMQAAGQAPGLKATAA